MAGVIAVPRFFLAGGLLAQPLAESRVDMAGFEELSVESAAVDSFGGERVLRDKHFLLPVFDGLVGLFHNVFNFVRFFGKDEFGRRFGVEQQVAFIDAVGEVRELGLGRVLG
jgi:hypothetical protein